MRKYLFALLLICVTGLNAFAHSGATGIVKERMDAMSLIGKNVKSIFLMLKGKSKYDTATIANSSRQISNHAEEFKTMFPQGSNKNPSQAAPSIWLRSGGFTKKADDLIKFATELTQLADKNSDQTLIDVAFGKVKGTCKSCHSEFRIKK